MITPKEQELCDALCAISLGGMEAKHNTVELCRELIEKGIEGDFVEAGVFAGTHPILMGHMVKQFGEQDKRSVHAIDSFCGIPKVRAFEHEHDRKVYGVREEGEPITSSGVSSCSVDGVLGYAVQFDGYPMVLKFHQGWFQDILPGILIDKIALLRLDVDLVDSLDCCLEYLYPKLVKGGWFVCDDYFSPTCKARIHEFMESEGISREEAFVIGAEQSIIYWRK